MIALDPPRQLVAVPVIPASSFSLGTTSSLRRVMAQSQYCDRVSGLEGKSLHKAILLVVTSNRPPEASKLGIDKASDADDAIRV
jgi:hypothetical protein